MSAPPDEAVPQRRLRRHRLIDPASSVAEASEHLVAVQSQELWAGRLALTLRTQSASASDVDDALERGELIRTWSQRGTLHLVAASLARTVVAATGERMLQVASARRSSLGIDAQTIESASAAVSAALRGGNRLTRAETLQLWQHTGIRTDAGRGYHLLFTLSARGEVVWGPPVQDRGASEVREQYLVSADQWLAQYPAAPDPEEALAHGYMRGHGPATVRDFAWWSGLTMMTARRAMSKVATHRLSDTRDPLLDLTRDDSIPTPSPRTLALGPFDEYYLGYADRSHVALAHHLARIGPTTNGRVAPVIVSNGRVVGTWKPPGVIDRATGEASIDLFDDAETSSEDVHAAVAHSMARLAS